MDYSKLCQGWIYCISNKINGKKYIGQTVNYKKRKYRHFHDFEEGCVKLNRAFKKYGSSNFEMYPIVHFKAINKSVCKSILNKLESFYINKYNTYKNGYNCSLGGEGNIGLVFSEEAKKKLSESHKRVCQENKEKYKARHCWKSVLQYDLNGRFIREFSSIAIAGRQFENENSARAGISAALKGLQPSAKGYIWKYKESDEIPLFIDIPNLHDSQPVYYYSKGHVLIAKYNSVREASAKTGILSKSIYSHTRKHKRNFYRTNYWSFEAPDVHSMAIQHPYEATDNYEFGRKLRTK